VTVAETELADRIRRLEDVRRIRQLIDLNWFLADAGPAEAFVELYTEDCVIDLGRLVTPERDTIVEGHVGVRARYTDTAHSQWEGRSHHLSAGPEAILVDGDNARALTYAITTMLIDGAPKVIVTGFNFWRLRRIAGRWRISHRWARRLGDSDNLELFGPIVGAVLDDLQPNGDSTRS
jgi:ketosteroid isomerase-like protein